MLADAIGIMVVAAGCFIAGLIGGVTITSMAAAQSKDSRMREVVDEHNSNCNNCDNMPDTDMSGLDQEAEEVELKMMFDEQTEWECEA